MRRKDLRRAQADNVHELQVLRGGLRTRCLQGMSRSRGALSQLTVPLLTILEGDKSVVDMSSEDPEMVKHMVDFLYKHDYYSENDLVIHAKVNVFGSKLGIEGLAKWALAKFTRAASKPTAWKSEGMFMVTKLA